MKVFFADRQLQQCFEDYSRAERRWGVPVARKYIQRVGLIMNARDFIICVGYPHLGCIRSQASLTGRFAIDLNRSWRLILTHDEDKKSVRILEVTNHYED